jgi:hypothetical protein
MAGKGGDGTELVKRLNKDAAPGNGALMVLPDSEIVVLPAPPGALAPAMELPVRWRASTRAQRVSMRICPREGAVVITLPPRSGRRAGMALLRHHGAWAMERIAALAPPVEFAPGAEILLGGVRTASGTSQGCAAAPSSTAPTSW